jgi:cytochrome P450
MTTPSLDDTDVAPTNDVAATRPYDELNVSSDAFWEQDVEERDLIFKQLREQRPITWQRPIETALHPDPNDRGFWAVVRHADIVEVSKNADVFVSRYGVMFDVLPPVFLQMAMSFLAMDNPQHDKVRGLVGKAFTRPQIRRIDEDIASRARRIVATAREKATAGEPIDFVSDISRHLPIEMFGDMFGVPEELRPTVAERWEHPADDLLTNLVQAEVDGEKLTDPEISAVMVLFAVAATDTTRHTASFAVKALTDFPDQRQWLWEDFEGRINSAIEEFLRWGSVVLNFRRTAVAEYELNGQHILPGDKVVMMYPSGNRDAEVFDRPDAFDLARQPNPHIAFGGGGLHFCLGNQLAKSMLRSLFRELHRQMPDFVAGEQTLMKTNFMRGVVSLPFEPNLVSQP